MGDIVAKKGKEECGIKEGMANVNALWDKVAHNERQ